MIFQCNVLMQGYVSWVGKVTDYDATLTQILYDAGAVPFVRTNVPQTLVSHFLVLKKIKNSDFIAL